MDGKIVKLTVSLNENISGRTALITVTSGEISQQVACTQAGNRVPIPDQETVTLDAKGSPVKVYITSVMAYTAQPEDSWLTTTIEGDSLVLTATPNYVRGSRNTTVNLVSGVLASKLKVKQEGLTLTPESTSVLMVNRGEILKVKVNSTLEFSATSDKDWLTVTAEKDFVQLEAGENTGETRTATVTLNCQGIEATISVTQTLYADFIGNWTLNAVNNSQPVTFNLAIKLKAIGETYSVSGFGGSDLAKDFPITMNFDEETGLVYILCQGDLGKDAEGNTVAFTAAAGGYGIITGTYIMVIGELTGNTVNWELQTVNLNGVTTPIDGIGYRFKDPSGGWHIYNADGTLSDLVMTKVSASANSVDIAPTPFSSSHSFTTVEKVTSAR